MKDDLRRQDKKEKLQKLLDFIHYGKLYQIVEAYNKLILERNYTHTLKNKRMEPEVRSRSRSRRKSNGKRGSISAQKLYVGNMYNIVQLKTHLMDEGSLPEQQMTGLIEKFTQILSYEPNLHELTGHITIIGDIHGQFYDLLKILSLIPEFEGEEKTTKLLFLGDYVDRGTNSVEVMTLMMALKVNYPKKVIMLRGNHQSRCMTGLYNFQTECIHKYGQETYQRFMNAFDNLPLAALINQKFFCVHGGISDKLLQIKKLNLLDRFGEIPMSGAFCDFIWADPINNKYGTMAHTTMENQSRNCSIYFGKTLTKTFFQTNKVFSIIRAHQVFKDGFQKYQWNIDYKKPEFPDVITVFSAPNYCGVYGNRGAIIKLENDKFQIRQYKEQSVNNKLYKYLETFHWSIPEVLRVVNDFSEALINSFYSIYLQEKFPSLEETSEAQKLAMILKYIHSRPDIQNSKTHRVKRSSTSLNDSKVEDEKQRLFNRSVDYFNKEHKRPPGELYQSMKLKFKFVQNDEIVEEIQMNNMKKIKQETTPQKQTSKEKIKNSSTIKGSSRSKSKQRKRSRK